MIPLPAGLERFRALGATLDGASVVFRVFTTKARRVWVRLYPHDGARGDMPQREIELLPDGTGEGFFSARVEGASVGCRYAYRLDDASYPDPYARSLPDGLHGLSEVVGPRPPRKYPKRPAPRDGSLVIYELHIGTFSPEGTFEGARRKLNELVRLGVNAVQIMPVSSFPGSRGWGYDGAAHYAPQASYGSLDELCTLVDEAHGLGLTMLLDVVYNHFGPDGNYLRAFSEVYFTHEIITPWGDSPSFAHPAMRSYLLGNALFWLDEVGLDGLRLDAIQHIHDPSPVPILRQLADLVHGLPDRAILVAEDWRNDPAVVHELGLDGILADDFHHQSRVLLTGEDDGYYGGYQRAVADLAKTIERGWLYEGQVWHETKTSRGKSADSLSAAHLFYCLQNHDQVGNRPHGDRVHTRADVPLAAFHALTCVLLFLPMTPLLFMGQEWAAKSPFLFFADLPGELGKAVTKGRRQEFGGFRGFADDDHAERIPDPQDAETYRRSILDWSERTQPGHAETLALYEAWLRLRREDPVLRHHARDSLSAGAEGQVLWIKRWKGDDDARLLIVNFGDAVDLADLRCAPADRPVPMTCLQTAPPDIPHTLLPWGVALFDL